MSGEITQFIEWGYRTASQYAPGSPARVLGGVIYALPLRNGPLRKVGTLKLGTTPQVPAARRVLLLEDDTMRVVRSVMSDVNGNYVFEKIDQYPGLYTIIGKDQTGVYNADIADRLTADPYP